MNHKKEFYCNTCTTFVCHLCWNEAHDEHEVISVFKHISSIKENLSKTCSQILTNKACLTNAAKEKEKERAAIQAKIKKLQVRLDTVSAVQEKICNNIQQVKASHYMLEERIEQISSSRKRYSLILYAISS